MQENYRSRVFKMMFELIFVFGVPAFLALWLGNKIDRAQGTDGMWRTILLVVAFISSWLIVARMYVRLSKQGKQVDKAVKEHREQVAKANQLPLDTDNKQQ